MLVSTQVSQMTVNLLYLSPKQQEVSQQCFPWVLGYLKLDGSFFKSHGYACKGPILKGTVGEFENLIGIGHMEVLHIFGSLFRWKIPQPSYWRWTWNLQLASQAQ